MQFKRRLAPALASLALAVSLAGTARAAEVVIAEPFHSIGYLPLYVAVDKGFFKDEGLDVKVASIENSSGFTNAVILGKAFGFIGGPEHNAYAEVKGANLRAVLNIVDRGNVYLVAKQSLVPAANQSLADFVRGKRIAVGFAGGTPNSILRYLLSTWKLDPAKDVTLVETSNGALLAAVKAGQADIAVVTEPQITQGLTQKLTGEPFYNVPKELGPYTYSTINVRLDSIKNDPATVEKVVRAMHKALMFTYSDPAAAAAVAAQEFPTMPPADLKASIDRSFKDEIWSKDGSASEAAWRTGKSVVMTAGLLKQDVPYADVIDMSFLQKIESAGK